MASFRKRNNKWQVRIQRQDYPPIAKSFIELKTAKQYAYQVASDGVYRIFNQVNNEIMKKLLLIIFPLSLHAGTAWEDSPYNWDNSEHNWDNSSNNWENSPNNWENNPNNWNSDRIIRDNSGNPTGYAVPKSDGGANIYDLDGNREGYY